MNGRQARERRRSSGQREDAAILARIRLEIDAPARWIVLEGLRLSLAEYAALRGSNPGVPFPSLAELDARSAA
jgi:hypothetical protein